MEAYPSKVRELILDAYEQGMKTKEIARRFKVCKSYARGVKQRWQEHQLRGVIQQKHGPDPLLDTVRRQRLADLVKETPDVTLEELRRQLDVPVGVTTVWRALNDMKLTLKKSPCTPANRIGRM